MKKTDNLLVGIIFIFLIGCNLSTSENRDKENGNNQNHNKLEQTGNIDTVSSEKILTEEISPAIDPKIQALLEKTKVLQVPLLYTFEDNFNINNVSENPDPFSDEMFALLSIEKINYWESDIREYLWLSYQVNLSTNYKTLIFTFYTGGEGEHILVNYSNNFEYIDSKLITYEDYVEGYYSAKSWLDNDKIILYESSYSGDSYTDDTTYFRIDDQGKIDTLISESEPSEGSIAYKKEVLDFNKDTIISQILEEGYSSEDFNVKTFNFLFAELKVDKVQFEDFIAYDPIFIRRTLEPDEKCFRSVHYIDRGIETPDYMCVLNKLYSDFDRTPDNISKVFNEKILDHIALLFNIDVLSKDYKVYGVLKGLLMTYEEMDDSECRRLCPILYDTEKDYWVNQKVFSDKVSVSDRVREYVTATPYEQHYSNTSADHGQRIFYLYSFWVRRYNEGNKEAVYQILKRLDEKIH